MEVFSKKIDFKEEFKNYGVLEKVEEQYSSEEMATFEAEYDDFLEWRKTYEYGCEGNICILDYMYGNKNKGFNPILFIVSDIYENKNLKDDGLDEHGIRWDSIPYYFAEIQVNTAGNKDDIQYGEMFSFGKADLSESFSGLKTEEEFYSFANFIMENYHNIYSPDHSDSYGGCYGGERELSWMINNFDFSENFKDEISEHLKEIAQMYETTL